MGLAHRRADASAPLDVRIAKPAVAVAVRMIGAVLLPEEDQGHAAATQLRMHVLPIRRGSGRRFVATGRGEQSRFQFGIVDLGRHRPGDPDHRCPPQILPRLSCDRSQPNARSSARSRQTHISAAILLAPSASTISRLASLSPLARRTTLPVIGSSTATPNTLLRAVRDRSESPSGFQAEPVATLARNHRPLSLGFRTRGIFRPSRWRRLDDDKDGIVPALLSAEITARMGRDPGEIYRELAREFGEPVYDRVEAPATPEQKQKLAQLSPQQVLSAELAGEKIQSILTQAPGNGAPIGGLKVIAESGWFAARPSGTEDIYKIYAESFRGADHLRRILAEAQAIVGAALTAPMQQPETASRTNCRSGDERTDTGQSPEGDFFYPRTSRDSIRWPSSPWICVRRGITPPTRCGGNWIRCCGSSRITLGSSCRPSRGKNSSVSWPIPLSARDVDDLVQARRDAAEAPAWFQQTYPQSPLSCVAYFSMEFMLSEALPIYSGGLGNVAGDQLKAASDLGVPVIGVGLLYQQGYFRQVIDKDGSATGPLPLQRSRTVADHAIAPAGRGVVAAARSSCPVTRSGCAPGRFRSAE